MYLITAIALIWLAVSVAITVTGALLGEEEGIVNGLIFLVLLFAAIVCFQTGAQWQRQDTLENYHLTPKVLKP